MLLSDLEIEAFAHRGMIEPFEGAQVTEREGVPNRLISYGLSSYGYDIRCAAEFEVFSPSDFRLVDPKCFDAGCLTHYEGEECIIPGSSFALARSVEKFQMPRNILAICVGKSTYARCGIVVNVTPLEPEWEGYLTIEISNTSPLPCKIYANEGIAQLLFFRGAPCGVSYEDRMGKYQRQTGITTAVV